MSRQKVNLYQCPVCRTVVEVLEECGLELTCCGPAMVELKDAPDSVPDAHGPAVRWSGNTVSVRPRCSHPMDDEHRIAWIEVRSGRSCYRRFFQSGQEPELTVKASGERVTARIYCNVHGLWRTISLRQGAEHERAGRWTRGSIIDRPRN